MPYHSNDMPILKLNISGLLVADNIASELCPVSVVDLRRYMGGWHPGCNTMHNNCVLQQSPPVWRHRFGWFTGLLPQSRPANTLIYKFMLFSKLLWQRRLVGVSWRPDWASGRWTQGVWRLAPNHRMPTPVGGARRFLAPKIPSERHRLAKFSFFSDSNEFLDLP